MLFRNRGAVHEDAALLDGARGGRAGSVEPPAAHRASRRLPASSVATIWQSERDMASILSTSCQRVIPRTGYFSSDATSFAGASFLMDQSIPAKNSTNPQVTPMSATLNVGKLINTVSMKSTT